MANNRARAGMATGLLVGVVFGTVFIQVNSGELPGSWPLVVRVAGAVVAVVLLAGVVWVARKGEVEDKVPDGGGYLGRRYWNIVGLEGLALFGGSVVISRVFERPEFSVPWVALVVGVHFVFLGRAWHTALYLWLGVVQTALALVGFGLAAAGVAVGTVNLVAGVLSGVALYGAVVVGVLRSRPTAVPVAG